ncbi:MAG: DNA polymerase III subunit beta [Cyclobacteriaceae bacterium]|nr:DNA polymerase III subunit beta [Cyclobacteriaceae bacterium]MCH8515568.1 DNA polymerase III subunit beta [Cyclobacteriaceae bacterium]
MRFIVSSSALLQQLNGISGVLASNPTVPILENFLFELEEGKLKITASDLQTSMVTEMQIDAQESGKIAIPGKILLDTLRNLPEQPVSFTIDRDTYSIELSSDNGRYKLAGENATDFPKIPEVESPNSVIIPSNVLSRAIYNTLFAASSDDLRPAMTGVYLNLSPTNTTFVATDGHRLIKYQRVDVAGEDETSMILPKKALNLLKGVLPGENTDVRIQYDSKNAFFSFGDLRMICRLVDEKFPAYQNVIPSDNDNIFFIDKQEMLSSLKRIVIYANKTTNQVRLKLAGSELQISAEDLDFSNEASERLSCEHESGDDLEIGFNAKFLIEVLGHVASNRVQFKLSEPNKAGLIFPADKDENEDILMLVMPVTLSRR